MWKWAEVKFRGIPLDVCVACNVTGYIGDDICLTHSEEVITPLFDTRAKLSIYKAAIKKIKQKELENGRKENDTKETKANTGGDAESQTA